MQKQFIMNYGAECNKSLSLPLWTSQLIQTVDSTDKVYEWQHVKLYHTDLDLDLLLPRYNEKLCFCMLSNHIK